MASSQLKLDSALIDERRSFLVEHYQQQEEEDDPKVLFSEEEEAEDESFVRVHLDDQSPVCKLLSRDSPSTPEPMFPSSVGVLFEMKPISRVVAAAWRWPYREWPTHCSLCFSYSESGGQVSYQVFEVRYGDLLPYMGAPRWSADVSCSECKLCADMPLVTELWKSCYMMSGLYGGDGVGYDLLKHYGSYVPVLGHRVASLWRRISQKQEEWTPAELLVYVLARHFESIKSGLLLPLAGYPDTAQFYHFMSSFSSSSSSRNDDAA